MVEPTKEARKRYEGWTLGWVPVAQVGDRDELPDATRVVRHGTVDEIKDDPVAQAYRSMFWSVDVDPTKRRPAGEALARRALEDNLPAIHPLVDAYNRASAATIVALSAFDRDEIEDPLVLDRPLRDDALDAIGEKDPVEPTGEHPVWRDEAGVVGLACYRDAKRTALGDGTRRALVVTLLPADLPPTIARNAFRQLEPYTSLAGWEFAADPTVAEIS